MKKYLAFVFVFLLMVQLSFSQQQTKILSHKPKSTGYEFSVKVVWNIIQCYDKVKVNIAVETQNIDIKAYYYEGKRYVPSDLDMGSFKSNIRIVNLSATVMSGQMPYGAIEMNNVNNYTLAGCIGQTFDITENLTFWKEEYGIEKIWLRDLRITNEAFIDHILNTKIRMKEKEKDKDKKVTEDNSGNTDDFWSIDEQDNKTEDKSKETKQESKSTTDNTDFWDIDSEAEKQKQKNDDYWDLEKDTDEKEDNTKVSTNNKKETFIDPRDGQEYKFVKIGNQTWMAENLNYATSSGSWCYDNKSSNCDIYGRLYNWETAKNVCPTGWHLPSKEEWIDLEDYLIANGYNYDGSTSGDKTGKSLASTSGWRSSSSTGDVGNDQSSNNITGFSGLPGGEWHYVLDAFNFYNLGNYGYWWSATESGWKSAWSSYLRNLNDDLDVAISYMSCGYSVRCVKDN